MVYFGNFLVLFLKDEMFQSVVCEHLSTNTTGECCLTANGENPKDTQRRYTTLHRCSLKPADNWVRMQGRPDRGRAWAAKYPRPQRPPCPPNQHTASHVRVAVNLRDLS